jgi:autotransporter-associated beta strand protein
MITMSRRSLLRNTLAASAGLALAPGILDWRAALASTYPLLPFVDYYQTNTSANLSFDTNADGYGAFDSSVTVTMDSSADPFGVWRNDISGVGGLVKQGSGALTLTGANSYAGGTVIAGGTVVAGSLTALGSGPLSVGADAALGVAAGTVLSIDGVVSLSPSSALVVALPAAVRPGTVIPVLAARHIRGTFATVSASAGGHGVVAVYGRDGVSVRVTS